VADQGSPQAAQAGLAVLLTQEMAGIAVILDVGHPGDWLSQLIAYVSTLTNRYGSASAALAARHYRTARVDAGIHGPFTVRPAPPPPLEQVAATVRWATSPLLTPPKPDMAAPGAPPLEPDLATAERDLIAGVEKLVLDAGRDTIIQNVARDPKATGWVRSVEPGACAFCSLLGLRGPVYKHDSFVKSNARFADGVPWVSDMKVHDNCVIGSTVVNGPSVEVAYRRWYEGELLVIRTSSGHELSVTPNHPVLAPRGWVAAGLLREGDDVIQRAGADLTSLHVPHEDDVPTRIEDVWRSLSVNRLDSVPVAAEDFHGDGRGSQREVEIVRADRLLTDVFDTALTQTFSQPLVPGAERPPIPAGLFTERDLMRVLRGQSLSANGVVRGLGELAPLLSGGSAHAHRHGLGATSGGGAEFLDLANYRSTGNAQMARDLLHGEAALNVHSHDVIGDDGSRFGTLGRRGTRFDPVSSESEPNGIGVATNLGRDLCERLAGGVSVGQVVEVRRSQVACHVFNLQTAEGWYDANSLVVSNCRCHADPVFGPWEPSAQVREWQQLYQDKTSSENAARTRRDWRRAYDAHVAAQAN